MNTNNNETIHTRVTILEVEHAESKKKIDTLTDGFSSLNLNLVKLVTSINTAVRMGLGCGLFVVSLISGLWAYHTYSTNLLTKNVEHSEYRIDNRRL